MTFSDISLHQAFFESDDFMEYLKKEYAVFLKLNENAGKSISINGAILDYNSIIADTDTQHFNIVDEKNNDHVYGFDLTFIRWQKKMKENYSSYFLDDSQIEHYEKTTTLNKKDTGFPHSVYVISSYFNGFVPPIKKKTENEEERNKQVSLDFPEFRGDKTEKDLVFKQLWKKVTAWILEKEKDYITKEGGEELWSLVVPALVLQLYLNPSQVLEVELLCFAQALPHWIYLIPSQELKVRLSNNAPALFQWKSLILSRALGVVLSLVALALHLSLSLILSPVLKVRLSSFALALPLWKSLIQFLISDGMLLQIARSLRSLLALRKKCQKDTIMFSMTLL